MQQLVVAQEFNLHHWLLTLPQAELLLLQIPFWQVEMDELKEEQHLSTSSDWVLYCSPQSPSNNTHIRLWSGCFNPTIKSSTLLSQAPHKTAKLATTEQRALQDVLDVSGARLRSNKGYSKDKIKAYKAFTVIVERTVDQREENGFDISSYFAGHEHSERIFTNWLTCALEKRCSKNRDYKSNQMASTLVKWKLLSFVYFLHSDSTLPDE